MNLRPRCGECTKVIKKVNDLVMVQRNGAVTWVGCRDCNKQRRRQVSGKG